MVKTVRVRPTTAFVSQKGREIRMDGIDKSKIMNTPPRIVLITGLPGSGKSSASESIVPLLKQNERIVTFRTDKQALEKEVRRDALQFLDDPTRLLADGGVEGDHSILLNPEGADGTLQMVFKDGNALNSAHKQLLRDAQLFLKNAQEGHVLVIEWAYGKNVPYQDEALTHDGTQLIFWLKAYGLLDDVIVIDVVSSAQDRIERNRSRPEHIPTGEFALYFPEEGHLTPEDIVQLGTRYLRVDNFGTSTESYKAFLEKVQGETESFVLPLIEGHTMTVMEGPLLPVKER